MGLTDSQLAAVMDAARTLRVEKRDVYLQRIAAMLTMRGRGHFNDADVADVAKLAMAGLIQQTTDVRRELPWPSWRPLGQPAFCVPKSDPSQSSADKCTSRTGGEINNGWISPWHP